MSAPGRAARHRDGTAAVEFVLQAPAESSQARNSASVMVLRSATFIASLLAQSRRRDNAGRLSYGGGQSGDGAAGRGNVSRARHRHLVGQGAAGRRRAAHGRRGARRARRFAAASALERAEPRRLGRRRRGRGSRRVRRHAPAAFAAARRRSASPARCTARRCSTPPASRCVRRSSGTTAARSPNAPSWSAAFPISARAPATSPCPASPRRRRCGSPSTSPTSSRRRARAAAQGLRPPAPVRRGGVGNVRRRGHAVARHRASGAGTRRCSRRRD